MMKFEAVLLLVAAVFAVSVVDARRHGLVKRDADCVLSAVGPVESILAAVMEYANVHRLLQTLVAVFSEVITRVLLAISRLNLDRTCTSKPIGDIKLLPRAIIEQADACNIEAIGEARVALNVALDASKDNLELLCYLQKCIETGIVACIATLDQVVAEVIVLPAALVTVSGLILPNILTKLLADVVACHNNITIEFNRQLEILIDKVLACQLLNNYNLLS